MNSSLSPSPNIGRKIDIMNFTRTISSLTLLTGIFFFFLSFKKNDTKEKLTLKAHIDKRKTLAHVNYLFVKTTLTNNSSDTIVFITMSCSYPLEYTLDTKSLKIHLDDCFKNVSDLIAIPPHKKYERVVELAVEKDLVPTKEINFRIGINLIRVNDLIDALDKRNKNIILFIPKTYTNCLRDTSYRRGVNFTILDNNGEFRNLDTLINNSLLWSNKLRLQ